jgi:hypothetical protein
MMRAARRVAEPFRRAVDSASARRFGMSEGVRLGRWAKKTGFGVAVVLAVSFGASATGAAPAPETPAGKAAIEALFADWRKFEAPPSHEGAPDYRAATFERRQKELAPLRDRLAALEAKATTTGERVDLALIRAEMNGFDFSARVLQPWARDPAFYTTVWADQSDTPAHEGPTAHGLAELWTYTYPLSPESEAKLAGELRPIPAFLAQARGNLAGRRSGYRLAHDR